jgi:hypothetical protein
VTTAGDGEKVSVRAQTVSEPLSASVDEYERAEGGGPDEGEADERAYLRGSKGAEVVAKRPVCRRAALQVCQRRAGEGTRKGWKTDCLLDTSATFIPLFERLRLSDVSSTHNDTLDDSEPQRNNNTLYTDPPRPAHFPSPA